MIFSFQRFPQTGLITCSISCSVISSFVNAYGPRQLAAEPYGCGKVRNITPAFACRALLGQPIEVYGDGKQVSDMVYVGDVAKALVRATEKAKQGVVFPHAVEVGPSENKTVGEIA